MSTTEHDTEADKYPQWYDARGAALSLASALDEIKRLDAEVNRYPYSPPPRLYDDLDAVASTVRDAVRFLCSPEADPEVSR